jgi:hypothetical protein
LFIVILLYLPPVKEKPMSCDWCLDNAVLWHTDAPPWRWSSRGAKPPWIMRPEVYVLTPPLNLFKKASLLLVFADFRKLLA